MKIGILGCGNIASIISEYDLGVEVISLYDKNIEKAKELSKKFKAKVYENFESFIESDIDTVLEIASFNAVRMYGKNILEKEKDLVLLSSGSLMDDEFRRSLISLAKSKNRKIYIPSGAVFGIDNIKVLSFTNPKRVFIKSIKSAKEFNLDEKKLIFKGKASKCVELFPKQTNITATISLASKVDADVEIWSDPEIKYNIHEIYLEGIFGKVEIKVENIPSKKNPKTSFLAALSVVAFFKYNNSYIKIGT